MLISVADIVITVAISMIYLIIIPFQLVIFPMKYYSVKDVIYSGNAKKATGALAVRFVFILLICWISWMLGKRGSKVIWGITVGSFLCAWPSIYHYQLFAFIGNKHKLLYFLACVVSVFFSWACAMIVVKLLLPMIYENKGFFLIDNNGVQTVFSAVGFVSPLGIRKAIKEDEQDNPYLVNNTFYADMYMTERKIQFERQFINQYQYEIEEAAEKYQVPSSLLTIVIQLEKINRGSWHNNTIERLAVWLIPELLIRWNVTLGLAQISIKNAHDFFHMAPKRYVRDMLKPEISIALCAYTLQIILKEYEYYDSSRNDDQFIDVYLNTCISERFKRSLYIASKYICGENNVLKKYVLIYAQLIYDNSYYWIA